jgi:abortive infection bacteriophage resistance protein
MYEFDKDFRTILNAYLQDIEVDLRTKVIYIISNLHKNNPTWFADRRIVKRSFIDYFTEKYNREIINNEVIRNHARYHINDRFAPAWKTLEFLSFGDLQRLIASIKDYNEQELIYKCYGFKDNKLFPNYIDTIRIVRNYCAHGHPLFDFISSRSIRAGKFKKVMKGKTLHKDFYSNIQGVLILIQYFLYYLPNNKGDKFREEMKTFLSARITSDIEPVVGFLKNTPWLEKKL